MGDIDDIDDLRRMDATAYAALVRAGEAKPVELVEAAIARVEELNPTINAVIADTFERARDQALSPHLPDGPFRGVPIVLKDLGACEAGMPFYQGNRVLKEMDFRAAAETLVAARFRQAGFVVIGKASTPEFGGQPTTQPLAFGPTRNPWDLDRSTSGSSGGSAAAVASGMVPAAHASDGYGSIRDPASWCGLVGLKPSRGRIPIATSTSHVGVEHALTRSVRDTAAILDCLHGVPPLERYHAARPARPFIEEVGADPGRLRVGVLTTVDASTVSVDAECVDAALAGARLLEGLGHSVDAAAPPGLIDDEAVANITLVRSCRSAALNPIQTALGRPYRQDEVEPYTWATTAAGRATSAADYLRAAEWQQKWSARIVSWWDDYDLLLTPGTGRIPMRLDDLVPPPHDPLSIGPTFHSIRSFAAPFNVTGQPAITLPLHRTAAGLPVGVQLVAAPNREDLLLRVAAQLESAAPWSQAARASREGA
jgi:amidase